MGSVTENVLVATRFSGLTQKPQSKELVWLNLQLKTMVSIYGLMPNQMSGQLISWRHHIGLTIWLTFWKHREFLIPLWLTMLKREWKYICYESSVLIYLRLSQPLVVFYSLISQERARISARKAETQAMTWEDYNDMDTVSYKD